MRFEENIIENPSTQYGCLNKIEMKKQAIIKEISERISPKTTPSIFRKIRNIAGIIATAGGLVLAAPVALPAGAALWIGYITMISGTIAGTSHLTKKKK